MMHNKISGKGGKAVRCMYVISINSGALLYVRVHSQSLDGGDNCKPVTITAHPMTIEMVSFLCVAVIIWQLLN